MEMEIEAEAEEMEMVVVVVGWRSRGLRKEQVEENKAFEPGWEYKMVHKVRERSVDPSRDLDPRSTNLFSTPTNRYNKL
eukprot:420484-Hanusia_phi.AAC.1